MNEIDEILAKKNIARVIVITMGKFEVWLEGKKLNSKDWGRDKSIQLFQFFLMARNRGALHKDQIMDRLWEDDLDDQGFKVALHGINKALEPERKSHSETKYFLRVGHTYQLSLDDIWVDSVAFEALVKIGNQNIITNSKIAKIAYRKALSLHHGEFLPDRIYEDWSSDERERMQLLFLSTTNALAQLIIHENPSESIQLCQQALLIDIAWEEAYRIQMEAYFIKGNRPMALKTYQVCQQVLQEELGIKPLPDTKNMYTIIVDAE